MEEPRNKFSLQLEVVGEESGMTFDVNVKLPSGTTLYHRFPGDLIFERLQDVSNNSLRLIARELELYLRQQRKKGH